MVTIGWFTPLDTGTGIANYSRMVLKAFDKHLDKNEFKILVFHPETDENIYEITQPYFKINENFLEQPFSEIFDIAVFNFGNNAHHNLIFKCLVKCPGLAILHDVSYQHFFAGFHKGGIHTSSSFAPLIIDSYGERGFETLKNSQVLFQNNNFFKFSPWDTRWAIDNPLNKLICDLSQGVIIHSDYSKETLAIGEKKPIKKILHPTDMEIYLRKKSDSLGSKLKICAAGIIQPNKNLEFLIGAISQNKVLKDSVSIIILGMTNDERYLQKLKDLIEKEALTDVVKFKLNLPKEQYEQTLSSADLFFNGRELNYEGASGTLIEQLALGKPSIVVKGGSYKEYGASSNIFLSPPLTSSKVEKCILSLINNKNELATKSVNAVLEAKKLNLETYCKDFSAFILENMQNIKEKHSTNIKQNRKSENYYEAKQLAESFINNNLFYHSKIKQFSAINVGAYLCNNILKIKASKNTFELIGNELKQLSDFDFYNVMGLFQSLMKKDSHFENLLDENFYKIIKLFRLSEIGEFCKTTFLNIEDYEIKFDRNDYCRQYLIEHLRNKYELSIFENQINKCFFELSMPSKSEIFDLPSISVGNDVMDKSKAFHINFYEPENNSAWTAANKATLIFKLRENKKEQKIGFTLFKFNGKFQIDPPSLKVHFFNKNSFSWEEIQQKHLKLDMKGRNVTIDIPEEQNIISITCYIQTIQPYLFGYADDMRKIGLNIGNFIFN